MLQIAVIGLGWAGTRQIKAIHELGKMLEVAAIVDNDPEQLRQAQVGATAKRVTNFADILADPEIDAVSICTPHPLHCTMAVAAAAAGKQILVEKPMATSVAEADRMLAAARANGVKLYVAENACYTPRARFLRDVVEQGMFIGNLTAAAIVGGFRAPDFGYPGRRAWLTDPQRGGSGTWMLHGIHTVAELRYILGEVAVVYMREHKTETFQRTDLEGTMSGLFTLVDGMSVSILQSCETKFYGDTSGYTLYGETGILHAGSERYQVFNAEPALEMVPLQAYPPPTLSSYALELAAFADHVNEAALGSTTGASERQSLAVVQAGYESAASGQPVDLRERFGS